MDTASSLSGVSPASDPTPQHLPELGFYGLAGGAQSPRDLLQECRDGEALGFGTVFLSERFNVKEIVTLSGAAAAVTERLRIATGVTNHTTRHPMVTASYASTMHLMTGGRFELGLGRGIDRLWDAMGLPRITSAQLEDIADLLRRLWHGEMVLGHDGPVGEFPYLHLDATFDLDIPLLLSAFGPNSLALGGRVFDGVILHTFFSDETLQRCVRTVKEAAERAGRDPDSVTVWSCYLTVGDWLDEPTRLKKTVGRLATYLQGYGDLMVRTNNWDPAVLERFRADELVSGFRGALDAKATTAELEHVATLIPDEWLAAAAVGSAEHCAAKVHEQRTLGADAVILHGAAPAELAPIVQAYADAAAET
ncbi:MAG: TIGR03857 family LLM class F420-dependent oxidoreductase [Ilumatobacter sp.]|nr:MAG: TIGR03857 family LLM class F420-dependent oxidoreductase [Ilumatobacter sp.]